MYKMKTHKAASKRIRITKTGKAVKRTAGQGHFNSRERGLTSMNKRRDVNVAKEDLRAVKRLIPYA